MSIDCRQKQEAMFLKSGRTVLFTPSSDGGIPSSLLVLCPPPNILLALAWLVEPVYARRHSIAWIRG